VKVVRAASLFASLSLVGCATVPAASAPLTGDWGGAHLALHLTEAGGTLDYDCAQGTVGPIVPGPNGSFTAQGTHTAGHGGPVRQGEVLPVMTARYDGFVRGDRMTIRAITSSEFALGPFELRRSAQPQLTRCL
jgi:hypothetical protein